MLTIHITAGLLALLAGAIALSATKGSPLHKRSGKVFVVMMLVMTGSATLMAAWLRPNPGNVLVGTLTFYLVCTGVLAVRRPVAHAGAMMLGLMLVAWTVGVFGIVLGTIASGRPNGMLDGIPAAPLFVFGVVGFVAAALDARLLLVAGRIAGGHRLARHLWRLGFAMWIATASFFFGQAKFFPDPVRSSGVLALPVLLVAGVLLYWLIRLALKRRPALAAERTTVQLSLGSVADPLPGALSGT